MDCGILVFLDDHFFNLWDLEETPWCSLKIPTPTPAPDHLLDPGSLKTIQRKTIGKSWEIIGNRVKHVFVISGFCIGNIRKIIAEQLLIVILLHFGLVTFRRHYGRNWNPLHERDLRIMSMTPETTYFYLQATASAADPFIFDTTVWKNGNREILILAGWVADWLAGWLPDFSWIL